MNAATRLLIYWKAEKRRSSYDASAMAPDQSPNDSLTHLRWLVASDPKQARTAFQAILNGHANLLNEVLEAASRPGDGRLRQTIATVFRTDPSATVLEPWLRQWLEVEPDEFTKNAIESALAILAPAPQTTPILRNPYACHHPHLDARASLRISLRNLWSTGNGEASATSEG